MPIDLSDKLRSTIADLPDPGIGERFLNDLFERHPREAARAARNEALISDLVTLAFYSPLLATTLLQHPEYIPWLERERADVRIRTKDDLLESLARFSMTHSQVEPHDLLARFRRRELLRIYLRDIRRLATVAEITEEISNLADAVLEFALRIATQEMDNRFGIAQETDQKGRLRPATFCIVALGKLGSKELNYSSDIDLQFLYSADGKTSGSGSRGCVTNREYFVKLAEQIVRIVGRQSGEGAAYRIDLRLRPHGTLGALSISLDEAARYYEREARMWERQMLIRSRAAAGDVDLFRGFESRTSSLIYSVDQRVEDAVGSVRRSKQMIDVQNRGDNGGFNVKLGKGGIREIEFIAQALQLAHGGRDRWLRAAHTLISLSRLVDRGHISSTELTDLYQAYDFLRRLEHVLQMENGLQTHTVPNSPDHRWLVAARMGFSSIGAFDAALETQRKKVRTVFTRVFGDGDDPPPIAAASEIELQPSEVEPGNERKQAAALLSNGPPMMAPYFSRLIAAHGLTIEEIEPPNEAVDYHSILSTAVSSASDFRSCLAALRQSWSAEIIKIAAADLKGEISLQLAKDLQTRLAEASLATALSITRDQMRDRFDVRPMRMSALGLGKLGGRGVDYGSDLDLILIHDGESRPDDPEAANPEYYARAAEILVTALSGMTRHGNLYRVDLRLRPYGKNGTPTVSRTAFFEYIERHAAIWELLAYAKLRFVAGPDRDIEADARRIVHSRAASIEASTLAAETRSVRRRLELERARTRGSGEVDIKYGEGGMLDIYFTTRFLQLRDNVPDDDKARATGPMIERLVSRGSLPAESADALRRGYRFFSELDHQIRLLAGRTTRLALGKRDLLESTARRMGLDTRERLIESLQIHRVEVRSAFEQIVR